jgi:hypothetical protein
MPDNPYFPKRYDFTRSGSQLQPPAAKIHDTSVEDPRQTGLLRALDRLRRLRTRDRRADNSKRT